MSLDCNAFEPLATASGIRYVQQLLRWEPDSYGYKRQAQGMSLVVVDEAWWKHD